MKERARSADGGSNCRPESAVNLARIDDLELCSGTSNDIELGTMFTLSVAEPDSLLDLMMLVNYRF